MGVPDQRNPSWDPAQVIARRDNYKQYSYNGYSMLHNLAANIALKESTGVNDATISMMLAPEQANQEDLDDFSEVLQGSFPLIMIDMYILPVFTIVSLLVKEKEHKTREAMRIMGMTDFPYWMSWFVFYTVLNTCISTIGWAVLCINCIRNSNIWYMWVFMWLYGQASFGQIIIMQSLFSRSKFSGMVSSLFYFSMIFVYPPVKPDDVSKLTKFLTALIP
jgi:hypothetical protein